ncbi:TM0996/MTH895 family glutaredoxin-like protein [Candidatus Bipolaricaulota bacterium]|nr:TM0996/MTH895 family glutaredoxin-like protein [Candidatus Bipolaricaulota bacterium]
MKIEILGTGCPKCQQLLANVQTAVAEAGIKADISKVEDITEIVGYGVMLTPALVVEGDVKSVGKVLTAEEIKAILI